jgi:type VI protein secretion system component Hcp
MEYFKPTVEEFGNPKRYKVLPFLFEFMETSSPEERGEVRRMLFRINNTARTEVSKASPYIFKLILNDFKIQIAKLQLPEIIKGYLNNYLKAKFVNSVEDVSKFVAVNSTQTWNKRRLDNSVE